MKKIVVERDPTIDVGNTSITTDDLVAILRIHADEHEITARVGEFYEHERYEFDSFLDIEKHQSLLGTPLTIKISDVTVSMGESGTHISYNNSSAPLAEQLSNSLKVHRRWTEVIQSSWAPAIISLFVTGIVLLVKPEIFDSVAGFLLVYVPVAVFGISLSIRTKKSVIKWTDRQNPLRRHKALILITAFGAILGGLVSQMPVGDILKNLTDNADHKLSE